VSAPRDQRSLRDHVGEAAAWLASQNLMPDRQVLQLDDDTWLIHASIAYAGEVIAAVFSSPDEAWAVIAQRELHQRDDPTTSHRP